MDGWHSALPNACAVSTCATRSRAKLAPGISCVQTRAEGAFHGAAHRPGNRSARRSSLRGGVLARPAALGRGDGRGQVASPCRCHTRAVAAYSEAELAGLPAPVARYFRTALRDGQRIIRRARITWIGELNLGKPGADKWVPFTAQQDFVPGGPGMVWDARMAMAPGIGVRVRDSYVDGAGAMRAAILGMVSVADAHGTSQIAVAALQRYLGEAAWLPTALLPRAGVTWTAVSDGAARATLVSGVIAAAAEFRFAGDGTIASVFVPDRNYDDGKRPPMPLPWQGRYLGFQTMHGMRVPGDAVVEWLFPQGPFAYWRGRPAAIEYDYSPD